MVFNTILNYFQNELSNEPPVCGLVIHRPQRSRRRIKPTTQDIEQQEAFRKQFFLNKKNDERQQTKKTQSFSNFDNFVKEPEPMEKIEPKTDLNKLVSVYTDGSCINNGKSNAQGGYAVYFPNKEFDNIAQKYINQPTNQRCELMAIYKAIDTCLPHITNGGKMELMTDSEYSMKCLQEYCRKWSVNGWIKADKKPIENRDIIEPLYSLYTRYWRNITLKHVRAHTGNQDEHSRNNDIVDQMARKAVGY